MPLDFEKDAPVDEPVFDAPAPVDETTAPEPDAPAEVKVKVADGVEDGSVVEVGGYPAVTVSGTVSVPADHAVLLLETGTVVAA